MASKDDPSTVHIFRSGIEIVGGISSNLSTVSCLVDMGSRKLIALEFLSDESLLLLCQEPDEAPIIVSVPLQSAEMPFSPVKEPGDEAGTASISSDSFQTYHFPAGKSLRLITMDAHDKHNVRGEIPARVCLLDSSRMIVRSFSIPE
jgi:anaphase-promoting complex subunit 4